MQTDRIPLSQARLYWDAWRIGVPFDSYGYAGSIGGQGYTFRVDKEFNTLVKAPTPAEPIVMCNLREKLMPIVSAKLYDVDEGEVAFTSFSILANGVVQVNHRQPKGEYLISYYRVADLYFEGPVYTIDEDE